MLTLEVPEAKLYDEESNTFFTKSGGTLLLEHSLSSLSKWESIWNKPFLDGSERTDEETRSYVQCMNLAPVSSEDVYNRLSSEQVSQIAGYINLKQTATWFNEDPYARPSSEIVTAEIVYYWMIAHNIPSEYQYWHFNKLLTLIRVCNEKNKPAGKSTSKMGTREQAASRRMLNKQRQAKFGTTG